MNKAAEQPACWWPAMLGMAFTILAILTRLDIRLADRLVDSPSSWVLEDNDFERWAYHCGPVMPLTLFGVGVLAALAGHFSMRLRRWRQTGIFLVLCMLIGPGLVVNGTFKEYYGRPRPKQVERYGGQYAYRGAWEIGFPRECKSFPCGHASVGFYYMAGYFLWYHSHRRLARTALAVGILCGTTAGWLRMGVGAHWFSDVVWSGIFVYYTTYASAWLAGIGGFRRPADG